MALLSILAIPALAQSGTITVALSCYSEPEVLTLTNSTDVAVTVTGITSSANADGDPERNLEAIANPGETINIQIGADSPTGSDNIFNNELNESATVYTSAGDIQATCEEGGSLDLGEQQGAVATKTFRLSLNGDVPEGETFVTFLTLTAPDGTERDIAAVYCGTFRDVEEADCEGSEVYDEELAVSVGSTITFETVRIPAGTTTRQQFHQGSETVNADMLNTAFFNFPGAGDDRQGDSQDDQQDLPEAMPETGAGGTASGLPVGSLGLALALLTARGYVVFGRR